MERAFLLAIILCLLFMGCASQPVAQVQNSTGPSLTAENTSNFTLHVLYFYRDSCTYCAEATPTVNSLRASYGYRNVVISYYELDHSLENRQLFDQLASAYGIKPENRGVPVVFIDGEYLMTFGRINQYLENEIKACLEAKCPDPLDALVNPEVAKPI